MLGDSVDFKVYQDAEVDAKLQPVKALTASIIECSRSMKLDHSPARNLQGLKHYVAADLKRLAIHELDLAPEIAGLLSVFCRNEGTDTPALPSSGLAISCDTSAPLAREVRAFENGLRRFLRTWMTMFPEPEVAVWPEDFAGQEKEDIREFIRLFVIDSNRRLLEEDVTEDIFEAVVDEIMVDTDFPVPKGHTKAIVRQVVKLLRKEILISGQRKEKKKAKKAEESMAEVKSEEDEVDDASPGKTFRTKRSRADGQDGAC